MAELTFGNVNALAELANGLQGSLDTVEDGAHDAGPELDRERLARPQHGVAHGHAGRLLVDLWRVEETHSQC